MTARASLSAPRVAWPTLVVLALAATTWALGVALIGTVAPLGVALATAGAYAAFTPMHEAAHRTISRARWVNEIAGRVAGIALFAPFPILRFVHLEHHKHTNEPDADPDHWSGRGPRWALPMRWLTLDIYYYAVFLRRSRPRREVIEAAITLAGFVTAAVVLAAHGFGREVVLGWLIPARIAIGVLAFALDYLPHRPHTITAREDRLRATLAFEGRVKCALSLGQSLHLVHHLYPGVPFYRYPAVWRDRVRDLVRPRA